MGNAEATETETTMTLEAETQTDEWVKRLRDSASQGEALAELRVILMRGLLRAFNGKGGGESFCEDVVQDTLVRILDKLDQFSGRSKFTTWAMSIGVRIGTSQFRRKMFQDVSINGFGDDEMMQIEFADEDVISPESQEDRKSLVDTLRNLISTTLTERQRQATEAILSGMPVEEIATRINSNRNAVYKLIHDARMRLKQGLETAGYSADDVVSTFA